MFGTFGIGYGSWGYGGLDESSLRDLMGMPKSTSKPLTQDDVKETCRTFCSECRTAGIRMRFERGPQGIRVQLQGRGLGVLSLPWRETPVGALWNATQEYLHSQKK